MLKPSQRRKARQLALQALYQWHLTQDNLSDIEQQFIQEETSKNADLDYFRVLFKGAASHTEEVEAVFAPLLSRSLDSLDIVDRAILRLATYEIKYQEDVPYRVALNEAIELAKDFAAHDSHKFVNGVLDKVGCALNKK